MLKKGKSHTSISKFWRRLPCPMGRKSPVDGIRHTEHVGNDFGPFPTVHRCARWGRRRGLFRVCWGSWGTLCTLEPWDDMWGPTGATVLLVTQTENKEALNSGHPVIVYSFTGELCSPKHARHPIPGSTEVTTTLGSRRLGGPDTARSKTYAGLPEERKGREGLSMHKTVYSENEFRWRDQAGRVGSPERFWNDTLMGWVGT